MPQKKKVIKKVVKKVEKMIKNSKNQPLLKNSINIKIDLDDDVKKKPKRKHKKKAEGPLPEAIPLQKREPPKKMGSGWMPSNDNTSNTINNNIVDLAMDKIKKLTISAPLAPPQLPAPQPQLQLPAPQPQLQLPAPQPQLQLQGPPTLASQSPAISAPQRGHLSLLPSTTAGSVAPQSINFNLASPVRPVGMSPLRAFNLAMNSVQQYTMASAKAASISQEELNKLFFNVKDIEQAEIKRATTQVKDSHFEDINKGTTLGAQSQKFKSYFKTEYKGNLDKSEAGPIAWQYYRILP